MNEVINRRMIRFLQVLYERSQKGESYELAMGKRYIRVVKITPSSVAGYPPLKHAHCYIEAHSGRVFKPTSWGKPANGVRYELGEEGSYKRLLERANPDGEYLL